ncbi:hypothetical protein [Granulicoccus phenolivorans]|uniref:hypothetical protein n=1 Tax=Granulicoccus phenolivorans TaxID=266854 RepID=UPI00041BDB54|nr:hypothetical protein [Granulicoccus phenolivorans]
MGTSQLTGSPAAVRRGRRVRRAIAAVGIGVVVAGTGWVGAYAAPRPITGTPNRTGAPAITAADYRDTLGPVGTPTAQRHYRLARADLAERWQISAAAEIGGLPDGFDLAVVTETGEECVTDSASAHSRSGPVSALVDPFAGSCSEQLAVYVVLERRRMYATGGDQPGELPLLLRASPLPPARNIEQLPTALPTVRSTTLIASDPRPVAPGSLTEPAVVETGTVSTRLEPNRPAYFSVPVQWGQALQLTLTLPEEAGSGAVTVLNPALAEVGTETGRKTVNVTCPPVVYRASGTDRAALSTQAGDYLVSVIVPDAGAPTDVHLTVALSGAVQGVPDLPRRHLVRDDTTRMISGGALVVLGVGAVTAAGIGLARRRRG